MDRRALEILAVVGTIIFDTVLALFGFTFPFERWLLGEMRPIVESALLSDGSNEALLNPGAVHEVWNRFLAGETSWSRPWSLFVLKRWCEQNL